MAWLPRQLNSELSGMTRQIPDINPQHQVNRDLLQADMFARDAGEGLKQILAAAKCRSVVVMGLMSDAFAACISSVTYPAGHVSGPRAVSVINIVFDISSYNQALQICPAAQRALAESTQPRHVLDALETMGVELSNDLLFLWLLPDRNPASPESMDRMEFSLLSQYFAQWKSLAGQKNLVVYHAQSDSDQILMAAAAASLFPKPDYAKSYRSADPTTYFSFYWFEERLYSVRKSRADDIAALTRLEQECWIESRRSSVDDINGRITTHPDGQWLLEFNGEIVGAVYSQRIMSVDVLTGSASHNVSMYHVPHAPVIQLLAVNVSPGMQHLALGDQSAWWPSVFAKIILSMYPCRWMFTYTHVMQPVLSLIPFCDFTTVMEPQLLV